MKILGVLDYNNNPKFIIELSHLNNKIATPIGTVETLEGYKKTATVQEMKDHIETHIIFTEFNKLAKDYRFEYSPDVLKEFGLEIEPFRNKKRCMHINRNCTHSFMIYGNSTIKCMQCGEVIGIPAYMNAYDFLKLFSECLSDCAKHKRKTCIHSMRTICDFNDKVVAIVFGDLFRETSDTRLKVLLYTIASYALENYKGVVIKCL